MNPSWGWTLVSCFPRAIWLESSQDNLSLPDVICFFWVNIMVIAITYLVKTIHKQELVADALRQRLDSLEQRLKEEVAGWL